MLSEILSCVPPSCFPSLCISESLQFLKRDVKKRQGLSRPEGKGTLAYSRWKDVVWSLASQELVWDYISWEPQESEDFSGRDLRASGGKDLEPDVHWPDFPSWLKVGLTVLCIQCHLPMLQHFSLNKSTDAR